MMELKAPTRTRREVMAIIIRETKGRVLVVKSLRKPGMSKEESNLRAKVDMRVAVSYLTLKIGFSPL